MKKIREKRFAKLLRRLAEVNVNVPFLYNNDGRIIADSMYSGFEKVDELKMPEEYFSADILNTNGRKAYVYDNTERPIAVLSIENSRKNDNDSIFEGYREYSYEANTVGNFFRKTANRIKNGIQYLFTRRSNASNDFVNEILSKPINKNCIPEQIMFEENKTEEINPFTFKKEDKKEETKIEEPVKKTEKSQKEKYNEFIKKFYICLNKEAFAKLGEYEKMFVEDAKAEGLVPSDNEFRQMLNERAVNKDAIMNYYNTLEDNETNKKLEYLKVDFDETKKELTDSYSNLGEFERMFIDDALADNLSLDDNEFNMMLSERTVNKNQVISFMKTYKNNLIAQQKVIDKYCEIRKSDSKDYSIYTINELRKELAANKSMLTKNELEKHNSSTLKKSEIIELMNRIDSKKNEQEISKVLSK